MSDTEISTAEDICRYALKAAGVLGVGQTPLDEDLNDTFKTLNMMIGIWNRKRWLIYHLLDLSYHGTGSQFYTVGPGMQFNVARADRIEAAYIRQISTGINSVAPVGTDPAPGSPIYVDGLSGVALGADGFQSSVQFGVDFPLSILEAREDYIRIAVKNIQTLSRWVWYDAAWPVGKVYVWPVLPATIYELHILVKDVLSRFSFLGQPVNLPPEYFEALWSNLTLRLRTIYKITAPDPQKDDVLRIARASLDTVRGANTQIPRLRLPRRVGRRGSAYNVYSDTIGY